MTDDQRERLQGLAVRLEAFCTEEFKSINLKGREVAMFFIGIAVGAARTAGIDVEEAVEVVRIGYSGITAKEGKAN